MAQRKPTERTNKFLEITDPQKAVGLWCYHAVRETAITPIGNTFKALGRFLPEDIARWKRRDEMAAAMEAGKGKGVRLPKGKIRFHSPAQIIGKYQEKCKQDERRLPLIEWRTKYRWLFLWQNYACRLVSAAGEASEPDVHMFFNAPSAGVTCHEGCLHSGRVFFLRTKLPIGLERPKDASGPFSDCGVAAQNKSTIPNAASLATSENDLLSRSAQADCVQKTTYKYFVAVVLKPGGTKWWSQIDKTNVTWTDNVYDRLIIDPRGGLSWSPILAEVINERVHEKDICLFMLGDDPLFKAITDNELNPHEKYAHLCYAFDFFCKDAESEHRSFYLRWSVFFNPKRGKFDAAHKSKPRVIEIFGERKKGWATRRIEVKEQELGIPDFGLDRKDADGAVSQALKRANGKRKPLSAGAKEAGALTMSDAKLGLGDTPLDKYAQGVAQWVAANNGCAVLPIGVSRELRLALSHALFFVTFPDRKPDEIGGILRGYQLPGRLVEHAPGKVHGDNTEKLKARVQKQSEEATARRRKMVVDCLFDRACAIVLERNADKFTPDTVKIALDGIGAKAILEKAAWRWGFMEGNPLNLFRPSRTAGNLKLPDLSLALGFEHRLGLSGNTATIGRTVQTARIAALEDVRGTIRDSVSGAYPCRSIWTPKPGQEKEPIAYPADSARIIRDEGRYYLLAVPKFAQYNYGRDFVFEPDVPGKARPRVPNPQSPSTKHQALSTKHQSVPVAAFHFESSGGVRSRSDVRIIEETFDYNKIAKLAREGRVYLYSIDFGKDKWLADLVYTSGNEKPCRIVSTAPVLVSVGGKKGDSSMSRKSGGDIETPIQAEAEKTEAFITFTFNPSIARDMRKWEGRSWKGYCDAIPAEAQRTVIKWPSAEGLGIGEQGLGKALQEVIATDGVLLTDKEHLDEANRAASYVIPAPNPQSPIPDPYQGYNLKDRVFVEDGRVDWLAAQELSDKKYNIRRRKWQKIRQMERKGSPLVEIVAQPETLAMLRRNWVGLIENDNLTDKKTSKVFTLEEPIRIGDEFKAMVEREFGRVAYTGTMKYQLQLVRPAHEVAVGIWLARLKADSGTQVAHATRNKRAFSDVATTARNTAPTPQSKNAQLVSEEQKKRLKTLDALLAEGLVTQEEYAAKKAEILGA